MDEVVSLVALVQLLKARLGRRPIDEALRIRGRAILSRLGYTISRDATTYADIEDAFWELESRCRRYTQTPIERMYALYKATEYIVRARVPGDIVECGVWRGGSAMLCALTLLRNRDAARRLHLFDTFQGLPEPGVHDETDVHGQDVRAQWKRWDDDGINLWSYASLDEVRHNMESTGYPPVNVRYIQGLVEQTVPRQAPEQIALLRLDTDWYESTRHELEHLYPRLSPGGVLIVDDVGHFSGARKAFAEYFHERHDIFVNRVDYTGRLIVKPLRPFTGQNNTPDDSVG